MAGWASYLSNERKRKLLETPSTAERLTLLIGWTRDLLAETEVTDKIGEDVRESVEKRNREFLLREQLKAIRKELGEGEPEGSDDYRARVEAADLPDHVPRGPRCVRWTSSNVPATRIRRPAGSAPGWTPSSTCPGG